MATREPQRVSAADFIRGFANWRLQAARKPVVVTHHGKDAHVLISLDDYHRLDSDPAAVDLLQASFRGLVESARDAMILIDRDWRIATLNPAASDMLECPATDLLGRNLADTLPGLQGNILLSHISRMVDHRERFSGEVLGVVRPREWTRVDLVPLPIGGALILRDISATMADMTSDVMRQALVTAIEANGDIGHACLSVREMVEDANDALTDMIGVSPAAIRRVRFSALLTTGLRASFIEALESVFRTGATARLASDMVTRDGTVVPVTLAIAERRGVYASEGAVVLVARR